MISSFYLGLILVLVLGPSRIDNRNPASPDLPYKEPPWDKSRAHTPTTPASPLAPSPNIGLSTLLNSTIPEDPDLSVITNPPTVPSSPILAQLTGDSISKLDALEPLTGSSNVLSVEPEENQQVSSLDTIEDSPSSPDAIVERPSDERKTEIKKQL